MHLSLIWLETMDTPGPCYSVWESLILSVSTVFHILSLTFVHMYGQLNYTNYVVRVFLFSWYVCAVESLLSCNPSERLHLLIEWCFDR